MKKHIVIASVPEFAGSNAALKNLTAYLGEQNLTLVLESQESLANFEKLDPERKINTVVIEKLHLIATFKTGSIIYNIKEFLKVIRSIFLISIVCIIAGSSNITISCTKPEGYLYLFLIPFIKIHYILHSEPLHMDNWFTRLICNCFLSRRKKVSTVSNANRTAILKMWRINKHKATYVLVIYNCLHRDFKLNESPKKKNSKGIVLTMGHLVDYKNPYLWLDVARQVTKKKRDITFLWLGDGPLINDLREKSTNRIRFLGKVDNPIRILKESTIYYQPSRNETQGMAVIEAMANYVPCVVSNAGGLPESVIHQQNGFVVDYNDVQVNVDAILNLYDDNTLQEAFSSRSAKRIEDFFMYRSFKAGMDKVYH